MGFNEIDLDAMFKSAADASEDTGEKGFGDELVIEKKEPKAAPKKTKTEPKDNTRQAAKIEPVRQETAEVYEHEKVVQEPISRPIAQEKRSDRLGPVMRNPQSSTISDKVDVNSISRILEMKAVLDNYNNNELDFVTKYFQNQNSESSELIYNALTTKRRDLEALDKIVEARSYTSADRAFFLMELGTGSIEAIYEQVNLITGELEDIDKISEINKIKVCRVLEGQISSMEDGTFSYISKLQEFTNKVLS